MVGAVGWLSLSVVNGIHLENPNPLKPENNKSKRKILNIIEVNNNESPVTNAYIISNITLQHKKWGPNLEIYRGKSQASICQSGVYDVRWRHPCL